MAVLATLEGFSERLGLVLARFGRILDGLGGILGASWRSGGVLATSWEPSWRLWGAILGVSGGSWTRKNI